MASLESIRGCPNCGLFIRLPAEAPEDVDVDCPRCETTLLRRRPHAMDRALAFAIAGFCFCLVLATSPFLDVVLYGRDQTSTLWLGPQVLDDENLWPLAIVVLLMTLVLPILRFALTIAVLLLLKFGHTTPLVVPMFRWARYISPWAMLEVYLLGFLVAYMRLDAMTYVKIDFAVYALVGAMLSMNALDFMLDREEVWEAIRSRIHPTDLGEDTPHRLVSCHMCHQASRGPEGSPCPRCQQRLHRRKRDSVPRAWAYLVTAVIFYVPANIFPIMQITSLGRPTSYTVVGGMLELEASGLLPLAILVFIASIAIPFLKMFSLGYLLISMHNQSKEHLESRTTLYRVIDFIGRWSMVDIFMISILVALMHFGQIAQVKAEAGAIYFATVVIFTMMATHSFDARLIWDGAGKNSQEAYG